MDDAHDPDGPLLDELRAWMQRIDPVPPVVTETARASLGWRRLDTELAELLSDSALDDESVALARGPGAPVRFVTFGAGELTIDLQIEAVGDSRTLRGQLSPPSVVGIEIQRADNDAAASVESDDYGRFRADVAAGRPIRVRVVGHHRTPAPVIETSWIAI